MALIGSSSDQEAVMTAMNGVDATDYPQGGFNRYESGKKNWYWKDLPYLGDDEAIAFTFFGYTNFMNKLTDDGGENWPGTQRGQWNDVPCNKNLWSWICSVRAASCLGLGSACASKACMWSWMKVVVLGWGG